jgi:hypothetical protein
MQLHEFIESAQRAIDLGTPDATARMIFGSVLAAEAPPGDAGSPVMRSRTFRSLLAQHSNDDLTLVTRVVDALSTRGIDVTAPLTFEASGGRRTTQTLLHDCIERGHPKLIGQLLARGADPRKRRVVQMIRSLARFDTYSDHGIRTAIAEIRGTLRIRITASWRLIEGANGTLSVAFDAEDVDGFEMAGLLPDRARRQAISHELRAWNVRNQVAGSMETA